MLFRKMLRDLKGNKTQFISIFLMSFLAIFIYSGLGSESNGYDKVLKNYYKETNCADVWLYSTNFTTEDKQIVEEVLEVTDAMRRISIDTVADMEGNPNITLYFHEEDSISKSYLKEGEPFDIESKDGIWLDMNFAKKRALSVGDTIKVSCMGYTLEKQIKGIIISPEYVYKENSQMIPDHYMNGFAYLSIKALDCIPLLLENIPFTEMLLTVAKGTDLKQLEDTLYRLLPEDTDKKRGGLSIFIDRSSKVSDVVFQNEIKERKAMTAVFPIAFLSIALLTILTTMTRMVNYQRTQIGVLKALGFQKRQITWHYVSYSFFLTLIGGGIGAVLGPIVLPKMFFTPMQTTYTLPVWKSSFLTSTLYVLAITVITATIITFFACHKILRHSAAETLRPQAPKLSKCSWLEKTSFWKKQSFSTQWNYRDVMRSKGRSIMAVVGVVGCMGLLITGFGCLDAFDSILNVKYGQLEQYQNQYELEKSASEEQIDKIIEEVDGEAVMEITIEITTKKDKKATTLMVNDNVTLRHYLNQNWKEVVLPKEGVAVSKKIAEKLDLNIGDSILWHPYGDNKFISTIVTMIYRDPAKQGIVMSKEGYEAIGFTFKPTSILSGLEKKEKLQGVSSIMNIAENKDSITKMLSTMYLLIGIVCVAACLLSIVVLYNLGVLSFAEKERELATLKVLGFQSRRIRNILLVQNTWLSLLGLIPGYYFGIFVLKTIMASMGEEFDMRLRVQPLSILICVAITMFLSVVVNYLFSGKVKKLDMVASLKAVE